MDTQVSATFGPYLPLGELGRGGLGTVDLVILRSEGTERLFAMKRLHPHLRGDPAVRSMFLREARVASLLGHPNIVGVHDVGEDDGGPFLVMDFIDGVSLATLIREAAQGELLPVELCVLVALQVARGLHAAHELRSREGRPLGLVHRDVSPQNVLVGFDGLVRLIDFGVAKVFGAEALTSTGILKGKLGYMSPEQLRFEPLDRRSDLFSLGILLYEMLAARRLYTQQGEVDVPSQILHAPPPDVLEVRRDVPPPLVALLFDLLAKRPADRPGTAAEVADQLEGLLDQLAGDEELPSLGAFVSERFTPVRAARPLEAPIASPTTAPSRWPEAPAPTSAPEPPEGAPRAHPSAPSSGRRRLVLVLLLVSTFVVGLAAALFAHWHAARRGAGHPGDVAVDGTTAGPREGQAAGAESEGEALEPLQRDNGPPDRGAPLPREDEGAPEGLRAASGRAPEPSDSPRAGKRGRRPRKSGPRSPWMTWD